MGPRRWSVLGRLAVLAVVVGCTRDPGESRIFNPSISRNGTKVAFFRETIQGNQLCILDLESKEVSQIKDVSRFSNTGGRLTWAPDDSRLYVIFPDGELEASIWVIPVHEGSSERVASIQHGYSEMPLMSPDGRYVLSQGAEKDLVVYDLVHGTEEQVAPSTDCYYAYAWSPQSDEIYFCGVGTAVDKGIWIVKADGTERRILSSRFAPHMLDISSTGRHVAFVEHGSGKESYTEMLWVSPLDVFDPFKVAADHDSDCTFDWAPESDVLVYESNGVIRIWSPSDGQDNEGNVEVIHEGYGPLWAKDANVILFVRKRSGLWQYDRTSGKQERLFPAD